MQIRSTLIAAAGLVALTGCGPEGFAGMGAEVARAPVPSGAELYATFCAACHGATGRGDGPAAAGMSPAPADLTRLSAANGGTFPLVQVMGKIYGYSEGEVGGMPEFASVVEGDTVLVETAPGVATPTPERLVALAEYLETLQAP
jgi:mono/diheme cytochrome c family protein